MEVLIMHALLALPRNGVRGSYDLSFCHVLACVGNDTTQLRFD
jgi:hypothetical protein